MRLLVCGGRNYRNWSLLCRVLDKVQPTSIVCGGASGADEMATKWAFIHDVPVDTFPALWEEYGRSAGPMRNRQMIQSDIDLVLAFPGGRGTADMISVAKMKHIQVKFALEV